ncbi:hypothetical protein PM082_003510 [Marasmius tenuissimus]|nr:hypothetical protein PM082_003510 [Marasmius tenuissimus]
MKRMIRRRLLIDSAFRRLIRLIIHIIRRQSKVFRAHHVVALFGKLDKFKYRSLPALDKFILAAVATASPATATKRQEECKQCEALKGSIQGHYSEACNFLVPPSSYDCCTNIG